MKKILFAIVLFVITMALVACDNPTPTRVPFGKLQFVIEDNPNLIGSYTISRENHGEKWDDKGEWTPVEAILGREIVCFAFFDGRGTFRARSDFEWVEVLYDENYCLELQKRK